MPHSRCASWRLSCRNSDPEILLYCIGGEPKPGDSGVSGAVRWSAFRSALTIATNHAGARNVMLPAAGRTA